MDSLFSKVTKQLHMSGAGVDMSLPFKRAAAKLVKIVPVETISNAASSAALSVSAVVKKTSTTTMLIIGAIVVAVIVYFVQSSSSSSSKALEEQAKQEQLQREQFQASLRAAPVQVKDPMKEAEGAYIVYSQSANPNVKGQAYNAAIQNFSEALALSNDPVVQGHICFRLAALYHQGVSETYVGDDRLPGIAPDAQQAIMFYREAIKFGYHGAVIALAGVYHWGLAGFEGNREVAMHLYGVVLKTGNDYEKGIAKDRLRQMREEDGKSLGTGMLDDDSPIATSFGVSAAGNPYQEHFMDIGQSKFAIGQDDTTRGIDEKYVDDLIHNKLRIAPKNRVDGKKKRTASGGSIIPAATPITSDPQNARDHVVVNSAKQSLERLRANTHMQYDVPTTFKMINEYITTKSDASEIKRDNAASVLKEMASGIANLGFEQSKEIEALHLVWNRIHSQTYAQDKEKRKQLIDNLVNELAECIEYGELVCPTGRLNRIIDSLNYQDPIVKIQPQWAVRQMMVARSAAIEKGLLSKCTSETRDAVNSQKPNARERQLQSEFSQKLKGAIERDLTREYVDSGLMTKELLRTELDAWML